MAKDKGKKVVGIFGWIAVGVAMILSVSALVKANNVETTKELGFFAYQTAEVNADGSLNTESKKSIVSEKVNADGMVIDFDEDVEEQRIGAEVFFFDEDGKFISSASYTEDVEVEKPENAETARVAFTPLEGVDEDGEVSLTEMMDYLGDVKVTVNK